MKSNEILLRIKNIENRQKIDKLDINKPTYTVIGVFSNLIYGLIIILLLALIFLKVYNLDMAIINKFIYQYALLFNIVLKIFVLLAVIEFIWFIFAYLKYRKNRNVLSKNIIYNESILNQKEVKDNGNVLAKE